MGLTSTTSHHRRRSSVLVGDRARAQSRSESGEPYDERTDDFDEFEEGNKTSNGQVETKNFLSSPDEPLSDQSSTDESGSEFELDDMASDDPLHDDEETGLTAREKRQRRRRRRKQRRELDARIANHKISDTGRKLADRNVLKQLLINAGLIGLWYMFSLSISIYNKWMFSSDHLNFHFPLFTTSLHMAVQFTLAGTILYLFPSLRPRDTSASDSPASLEDTPPKPIMTKLFYATRLLPCGTATSLDVGLGNMSLKFISLTFLTMCKSSALAFVLLFAFLFKLETPSMKLIIIITTMTVGVIMMVAGEAAFNAVGFALVIASAFFSGFRWALTQILLLRHPATSNPFSTLFFLTPIMFVSLFLIAIPVEGPTATANGVNILVSEQGLLRAILLLIFPGVLAFCMIAAEFALLKRSSVVTLSICGIFKEVITISAAGIVFHDPLTPINISGLAVTIGSIATYNYFKIKKMREEARLNVAGNGNQSESDSDLEDGRNQTDYQPDSRASSRLGNYGGAGRDEAYQALISPSHTGSNNNKNVNDIPPHDSLDRGRRSLRGNGDKSFGLVHSAVAGVKQEEMNDGRSSPRLRSVGPHVNTSGETSTENRVQQSAPGHRRRSSSLSSWSSSSTLPISKKERIRDLG